MGSVMNTVTALIVGAGAVCLAVLTMATFGRGLYRLGRRLNAFFDDWFGAPARPGRKPVPGIPERVSNLEEQVEDVAKQVTPNGGDSDHLGDRVLRIEKKLGTDPDHFNEEQP